jgi:predicted flap endonuclease-1-like 5' DNA nuclease
MKFKLTRGSHTRFEDGVARRYQAGEAFEPSVAELTGFGDRLELVEEDPQASTIDSGEGLARTGAELPAKPGVEAPEAAVQALELAAVEGIGEDLAQTLAKAGIVTMEDLARVAAGPELAAIDGIGKSRATRIRKALMALEKVFIFTEVKTQEGDGVLKEGSESAVSESETPIVNALEVSDSVEEAES